MRNSIGAVALAVALMSAIPCGHDHALAASSEVSAARPRSLHDADVSARRRYRHEDRSAYRAYYPGRPVYYAPAPFFPFPPFFAYGWEPW